MANNPEQPSKRLFPEEWKRLGESLKSGFDIGRDLDVVQPGWKRGSRPMAS
jgi:hypothetical protein